MFDKCSFFNSIRSLDNGNGSWAKLDMEFFEDGSKIGGHILVDNLNLNRIEEQAIMRHIKD